MDPVFQRLGDVTIQRLEKPKDKVGLQGSGDIMEKESKEEKPEQNIYLNTDDPQGVKRNFDNMPGPSTKRIKFDRLDFKRNMDESSAHSFSEPELSDYDTDSELESDEDIPMMKSQNSHIEGVTSELETSTDFLEKLVQEPFEEHESEELKSVDEIKTEVDDYEYDIKEKLKEMGEISFETVKKGEKPKKSEVSIENEVVVTPAKKMSGMDEDTMGERLKSGNMRRNIREVMDETKLDESTLAAQRQEMERLRRVQEQQRLIREVQRQMAQERVISLLQGGNVPKAGTSGARIGNTVLVKLPNGQTKTMTKLTKKPFDLVKVPKSAIPPNKAKSVIAIKKPPGNLTPSVSIAPVMKRMPQHFPMAPSDTDSENEDMPMLRRPMSRPKMKDPVTTIDISSDDDCIVVSESENDPSDDVDEDPSNSGMHTNDEFNQPDEQGRVVVNIGHPDGDPDIYLAPQIARIIKPHQIGGIRFLFDNVVESVNRFETSTGFGCILAHSMGLGKTLQVVSFTDIFLRNTPARTILCIMPINTLQNWMAEYNMWLPTEEAIANSPLNAHGEVRPRNFNLHVLNDSHKTLAAKAKVIKEWRNGGGVLLIGYEQYRLLSLKKHPKSRRKPAQQEPVDDDKNKMLFDEVHEALVKPGPDLVICDEGHRIKNSHASISQALKQMRTKRRVVLTGYPLQNNLMEYWCMVDFVRPNYLGTKTEFCNMFERPIQNGQCIDSTESDIKLMRYRAHVLHSLLVGFVQRRSHTVLQTALPQKEEYVLLVRMTDFQRTLYETFMNEVVRTQTVPNPLKAFAVCCKIWNHPDVLYYFLKKQAGGEAVDIDLEEVSNSTASSNESTAKTKKGSKKSLAKGKNSGKPAASVTPYNSSGDASKKTSQRNKNSANKNNANNTNQNQTSVPNNLPINQQISQPPFSQTSSTLSQSNQQTGFTQNSTGNYQNNMNMDYSPNKQVNNFNEIQPNQGSNHGMPTVKQEDDAFIQNNQVSNSAPNSVGGFPQKLEYNNFCSHSQRSNQSSNFTQNPPSNYSDSGFSQQTVEYSQNSQGSTFSTSSVAQNPPSNISQDSNFSNFSQPTNQIFSPNQSNFVQNQFSSNAQTKPFPPPSPHSKPIQQEEFVTNNFSTDTLKNPQSAFQNAVANFPDGSVQNFPLNTPNSNFPAADTSGFSGNNQNPNFSPNIPPNNSTFPPNNSQNSSFSPANPQNAPFPLNNSQNANFPPNSSASTNFASNNPQAVNFSPTNQNSVTQSGNQSNNFPTNGSQNSNYSQSNNQNSNFGSEPNSNCPSSNQTYTPNNQNTTFLHPGFNTSGQTSNFPSNNQTSNFPANNQNTNFHQSPQNNNNFPSNNQSANFPGNNQSSFPSPNVSNTTFPNNHHSNFSGNSQNFASNQPPNFPSSNPQVNNFAPSNHNSNYPQSTSGSNFSHNQILQSPEPPPNFQQNSQNNSFSATDNLNQNTFNPPNNQGTFTSSNNQGTFTSPNSQTTFNPPNSQTTFNPPNNQTTFNPPSSQTTFNPPNNPTTFNSSTNPTTFNSPTNQNTFNQSNFEQSFNQNNHSTSFPSNQNNPSQAPSSNFNNQQSNYSQGNYTPNDPAGNSPTNNFSHGDNNVPSSSVTQFPGSVGFPNNGSNFVSNNSGSNFTANQSDNIAQNTQRNYIQNPNFPSPNTNQVSNFQPNPSPSPTFSPNSNQPTNYPSNTNPSPNFPSNNSQSPNFPNPNQPCNFPSNINQPSNFSPNMNQSNFSQSSSFPQNTNQSAAFPQSTNQTANFPQNANQPSNYSQNSNLPTNFQSNPIQPSPNFPSNPNQSPKQTTNFSSSTNQPTEFPISNSSQPVANFTSPNCSQIQQQQQIGNMSQTNQQAFTPNKQTNFLSNQQVNTTNNQPSSFPLNDQQGAFSQNSQQGSLNPSNQQGNNYLPNSNQPNNFPVHNQQGNLPPSTNPGNFSNNNGQAGSLPGNNQQGNFASSNNQQSNFPQNNQQANFSPTNTSTTTSQNQHQQPFPPPSNVQNYQQQQGFWGQDSNFKQPNDTYNNFRPPFNQNFANNPPWMKKDDIKPIINSPIKLEGGSSSECKPKINIISDIKISSDGTFDMKKINILSDIKLDPKKEFDEMKEEKADLKNLKSDSTKFESNDEDPKVANETAVVTKAAAKEDTGIPYDWAIELLKDYVPGIIENSAKMDILFCIVKESIALGDRLLVFSQSLITLDLIEQFLQMNTVPGETHNWAKNANYYRLDGSTSALEREKLINEFNSNPKIYLFLVSTRAGSLGINLIGANRVVVLDASWNPCHDTQAVCRVYRYGQRKPCFVYRLVVDNCLEKKIYDRQINKQGMSDRVVDECNPDAHLTMKDVSTLCWDDAEEGEVKDWSHCKDNYIDVVLQKVLIQYGTRLNKEPFQHESLLVDRKDKQLSQQEKRLAKKGYEREKQAARQPAYNVGSMSRGHRPVASVRPMQQGGDRPTRWIPAEHWQRQGMTAQEMTLPLDVVIPTNQPDKGNIVLKAGQKVLVLKSPKGVYMQLESGKIVAIKTAIKVRGKAEDDAAKVKQTIPPAIKNNAAISVLPQKRAVRPFTPNLAKLNMRSIKQNVPNLVSRIQSVTKRVQTAKTKPYQIGQEIARAVNQAKSETESHPSSSDEERVHVEKRHFNFSKDSGLTIEPKIKGSGDTSRSNSLERRDVSSSEIEIEMHTGAKPKTKSKSAKKSASALERLEQSTSTIMSESKQTFQETLDSITSTYPEEEKLSDTSSHASTTHSANQSSQSISSTSDQEVIPVEDQPYPSESETTPSAAPADPSKSDIPTPEYGYNNYYGYNHMQPYPPPPQGYPGYPQPPPYDMMGYPQPQQPQYNYGMYPPQNYPPQHQYPPQGPYDYGQPPPQGPVYPGYHAPYPPQQYPPPPQGMYPPPGGPPPAGYPEYQYPPPPPHNAGPPPPPAAPYYPGH